MSDLSALTLILDDKLAPKVLAWWDAVGPDPNNFDMDSLRRVTLASAEEVGATLERCQLAGAIVGPEVSDMAIAWLEHRNAGEVGKDDWQRVSERDDDRRQARRTVQTMIARGDLPKPKDVICMDCKLVPAREYDHFMGYGPGCHKKVEAICAKCHHKREADRLLEDAALVRNALGSGTVDQT